MAQQPRIVRSVLLSALALVLVSGSEAANLEESVIYIEYNASGNDLGFHVFLDGEDWEELRIVSPAGATIFEVAGRGGYGQLGMTELFFEGAEPSLDDFPLGDLLALFPEGRYTFVGETVDDRRVRGVGVLSHAVPAAPEVSATYDGEDIVIRWEPVTGTPTGFPSRPIEIVGYQVIFDPFQVTMPPESTRVTLPPELVDTLRPGEHDYEVLAIDQCGNQSITEGVLIIE